MSVRNFVQGQGELIYKTVIQQLQKQWNKSIEVCGDYVVVLCFLIYEARNLTLYSPRQDLGMH